MHENVLLFPLFSHHYLVQNRLSANISRHFRHFVLSTILTVALTLTLEESPYYADSRELLACRGFLEHEIDNILYTSQDVEELEDLLDCLVPVLSMRYFHQYILNNPGILNLTVKRLEERLEVLKVTGKTTQEIREILLAFPKILTYTPERLFESLAAFENAGMDLSKSPRFVMFNPYLINARCKFLRQRAESEEDLYHLAFLANDEFEKRYGITREKLITDY